MQTRLDGKLALLYTLLVLQILIVMIYVASTPHIPDFTLPVHDAVSFVNVENEQELHVNQSDLWTIKHETILKEIKTIKFFQIYNKTLCWKYGVDYRQTLSNMDDRCYCKPVWHGLDCGQPEVVWRAIMASKQNIKLKRRKFARRIVHTIYVHDYDSAIAEVIVEELYKVVDLFVICDFSTEDDNFRHKLAKGLLRNQQNKILYIDVTLKAHKPTRVISKYVWDNVRKIIKNLHDDDIYVTTNAEQILNSRALMFLKIYDGWPQPIGFRLRWSVYGFFWQHPLKTMITIGACTIGMMREAHRLNSVVLEKELTGEVNERETLGLVIGDLNHYGGWFCHFCQSPANIVGALRVKNKSNDFNVNKDLDVPFVEELIGTGVWLDEKTSLSRAYKSRDLYFAPEIVLNKTWKYDWLVENFYAKLDYY